MPYPKDKIKHALATLLLIEEDNDEISLLGEGYTRLDSFVSDEVYKFVRSKISIPDTTIDELKNPTEEVLGRLHRMFELTQEDEELQLRIMSGMRKERVILYKELSTLLGIIGDPNNLVTTLEQIIERMSD